MADGIKQRDLTGAILLTNAVVAATQSVRGLHSHIERLQAVTRKATEQIEKCSSSMRSLAAAQLLMSGCRCARTEASKMPNAVEDGARGIYQRFEKTSTPIAPIVNWTMLFASFCDFEKWLRAKGNERVFSLPSKLGGGIGSLTDSLSIDELTAAAWDRIAALLETITAAITSLARLLVAAGVTAAVGAGYLVYENWGAVKHFSKGIWDYIETGAHAMREQVDLLAAAVLGAVLHATAELRVLGSAAVIAIRATAGHLAMLRAHISVAASELPLLSAATKVKSLGIIEQSALADSMDARQYAPGALDTRLVPGVRQLQLSPLRRAAASVLAIPMLAAPALAAAPALPRPVAEVARQSLVINSSPTIVINSGESGEIESRVLEALREHREALFDQWQSELRKRQRTEF
jgi:hypothetical protein